MIYTKVLEQLLNETLTQTPFVEQRGKDVKVALPQRDTDDRVSYTGFKPGCVVFSEAMRLQPGKQKPSKSTKRPAGTRAFPETTAAPPL